jgi:uncharacterized protein (TIGR02996 family)
MSVEAAFLAAIKAAPSDNTPRLVYADWLDEQGRPGGDFLRVECELAALDSADESRAGLLAKLRLVSHGLNPGWMAIVSRVPINGVGAGIRCEFCHAYVSPEDYPSHRAGHTELLPDGQHRDYASLPPEERYQDSVDGEPRVYVHLGCGGRTVMQESIIRSYLKNPFMYNDLNFCTGCGQHVRDRECVWQETGENLHAYMERLRARARPSPRGLLGLLWARIRSLLG